MNRRMPNGTSDGVGAGGGNSPGAPITPRPSGDYLARTSVFWMESSRERRRYIRSAEFAWDDPA
jgi:hypothetical protein